MKVGPTKKPNAHVGCGAVAAYRSPQKPAGLRSKMPLLKAGVSARSQPSSMGPISPSNDASGTTPESSK